MSNHQQIIKYYDQLASSYDENRFANSYGWFIHQRELGIITSLLTNTTGVTANVACGTGRFMELAEIGIDASSRMIHQAKTKFPNKVFYTTEADNLPFENASIDTILCFHLFMHLSEQSINKIINECYRVLKPGGHLIFDFPSSTRRKMSPSKSQGWHGQTSFTPKWVKENHKTNWVTNDFQGILFLPIHRIPKSLRGYFLKLDRACHRLLPVKYAQYIICSLYKGS